MPDAPPDRRPGPPKKNGRRSVVGGHVLTPWSRLTRDSLFVRHSQIVGYRENSRNSVRANVSNILVGFSRHYARQGHMTVVHDDMNRRVGAHRIPVQTAKSED